MTKTDASEIRMREAVKADVPRVAELIMHGGFRTIDLTRMGYERLQRREPLFEKNIF